MALNPEKEKLPPEEAEKQERREDVQEAQKRTERAASSFVHGIEDLSSEEELENLKERGEKLKEKIDKQIKTTEAAVETFKEE